MLSLSSHSSFHAFLNDCILHIYDKFQCLSIYQNNNVSVKIDAVSEVIKVCGCLIATSYLLGGLK